MDIVERLRKCANGFPLFKTNQGDYGVCDEAADEIERLREQVEFERASLQAAFGELTKLDKDIVELKKTIETLEEEVYLRTSDLTHVIVGMNYKE